MSYSVLVSTFRTLTLVIASLALFGAAIANSLQTGKGPVSVGGPSYVSPGTSYQYTVTVDTITRSAMTAPGDTYVDIACDNTAFHPSVSTLRIPAGSNVGYFYVTVDSNASGTCEVLASNSNGAAAKYSVVN